MLIIFRKVMVLHSFLNVAVNGQLFSLKSSSWIAFIASLMAYLSFYFIILYKLNKIFILFFDFETLSS